MFHLLFWANLAEHFKCTPQGKDSCLTIPKTNMFSLFLEPTGITATSVAGSSQSWIWRQEWEQQGNIAKKAIVPFGWAAPYPILLVLPKQAPF